MNSNGVVTSASGAIKELAKVINACILDEKNRAAIMSHLAESQKYLDNAMSHMGDSMAKADSKQNEINRLIEEANALFEEDSEKKAKASIKDAQDLRSQLMDKASQVCSFYNAIHEYLTKDFQQTFPFDDSLKTRQKFWGIMGIGEVKQFLESSLRSTRDLKSLGLSETIYTDINFLISICEALIPIATQIASFLKPDELEAPTPNEDEKHGKSARTAEIKLPAFFSFHPALPNGIAVLGNHVEPMSLSDCAKAIEEIYSSYFNFLENFSWRTVAFNKLQTFIVTQNEQEESFALVNSDDKRMTPFIIKRCKNEREISEVIESLKHMSGIGTSISYSNISVLEELKKLASYITKEMDKMEHCAKETSEYSMSLDNLMPILISFPALPPLIMGTEYGKEIEDERALYNKALQSRRNTLSGFSINKFIEKENRELDKVSHLCNAIDDLILVGRITIRKTSFKNCPDSKFILDSMTKGFYEGDSIDVAHIGEKLKSDIEKFTASYKFHSSMMQGFWTQNCTNQSDLSQEEVFEKLQSLEFMFRQHLPQMPDAMRNYNHRFKTTANAIDEYNAFLDKLAEKEGLKTVAETIEVHDESATNSKESNARTDSERDFTGEV